MKRIVKLNEKDLSRIVRRVINEGQEFETCKNSDLSMFMSALKDENSNLSIKVETDENDSNLLIFTQPNGRQCGCLKSKFFV